MANSFNTRSGTEKQDTVAKLLENERVLFTLKEAAELLRISTREVSRRVAAGSIRAHKYSASQQGAVRIPRDAIADFLRATAS
jgi:excisionase family DNA binding protein